MKGSNAHSFFSDNCKDKIRLAVESAELATSGEIATMVVDHSDRYHEAEVLGGVLVAGLAALILSVAAHYAAVLSHNPLDMTIWSYIPLVFILYFPARSLFMWFPQLKLPFIEKKRLTHAVRERAVRAFYEKRLYKTRDENGILIFISLLERKVWILGDRGIDRMIPHETWLNMAREVTAGVRAGRACAALCSVIEQCGKLLAQFFPKSPDDSNELPDDLIM